MTARSILYAQSGGVTAVINATACGVIQTAAQHPNQFSRVLGAHNGILGVLKEELIDTSTWSHKEIAALKQTPAGAFGSCRYKLKDPKTQQAQYQRLFEVLKAHDVGTFFYNGGGDSQDTAHKMAQMSQAQGFDLTCIGIPKTIDNDLPITDNCPGFGSVAKYVAVSIQEATLDVASMAASSTKVFIMEVMGRHTGWIAAASGLAARSPQHGPHIILFPERAFNPEAFLAKVKATVERIGYCAIVVSEGVKNAAGRFLSETGTQDAFGHAQLGGVAPTLANLIKTKLNYKYHWAVLDYLQRSARHIASQTDLDQAYAMGKAAVEFALAGKQAVMPCIIRKRNQPYAWEVGEAALSDVANVEKTLPDNFITPDGFHITQEAKQYLLPLIQGEAYPTYHQGLPDYQFFNKTLIKPKLKAVAMNL